MKYKLLKIDGYWIIVSKQEILPNSWYENNGMLFLSDNKYNEGNNPNSSNPKVTDHNFKLIYSQNPEHNLPSITFSDKVVTELGIVDVEKKISTYVNHRYENSDNKPWFNQRACEIDFKGGYEIGLSVGNDKLNTASIRIRAEIARKEDCKDEASVYYVNGLRNALVWIQSITKQEYECELEMEMKYEDCLEGSEFILRPAYKEPKLSSGSVKVIKLIK